MPRQPALLPPELPAGLRYVPGFVTAEAADDLVRWIDANPWCDDLKRRVQQFGYRYDYKARQARREDFLGPLPGRLQALARELRQAGYFDTPPDQVIVNEYLPGQGIAAHVDCRPCFGEVVASLSLLSACVMRLEDQRHGQRADLQLAPRSLLVLSGPARHHWSHAIAARKSDLVQGQRLPRTRRLSLTFRQMRFV